MEISRRAARATYRAASSSRICRNACVSRLEVKRRPLADKYNVIARMRVADVLCLLPLAVPAFAQEPPPKIGPLTWSIVPEGRTPFPSDSERLRTINYGGGARWFAKKHLAFSFDVRFYAIDPGSPYFGLPGSPRATLLIIGAGVSVK